MKILFLDLETRKLAEDLRPDDVDAGWEALRNGEGGISALMIYDTEEEWMYIYDDTTIQQAARHIESADAICGFRSEKFDIPVIEGVLDRRLAIRFHYDVYTEIAQATARRNVMVVRGDNTLNAVALRTIGRGKTESGKHAPELLRSGRVAELFNYCGNDVKLTYDLMKYICQHGGVTTVNNSFLGLTVPDWLKREIVKEY